MLLISGEQLPKNIEFPVFFNSALFSAVKRIRTTQELNDH